MSGVCVAGVTELDFRFDQDLVGTFTSSKWRDCALLRDNIFYTTYSREPYKQADEIRIYPSWFGGDSLSRATSSCLWFLILRWLSPIEIVLNRNQQVTKIFMLRCYLDINCWWRFMIIRAARRHVIEHWSSKSDSIPRILWESISKFKILESESNPTIFSFSKFWDEIGNFKISQFDND